MKRIGLVVAAFGLLVWTLPASSLPLYVDWGLGQDTSFSLFGTPHTSFAGAINSTHFSYMRCDSGYGTGNYMMGFMKGIGCQLHWDSLLVDSLHRTWHPTGVHCWNGTSWVTPSDVSINGNKITFVASELYAAIAITGEPTGVTAVVGKPVSPSSFTLEQNYPNPFNPSTRIQFSLPNAGFVELKIFNDVGQQVKTLVSENRGAGTYTVEFDGSAFSSGLYFYKLQTKDYTATKQLLLLK